MEHILGSKKVTGIVKKFITKHKLISKGDVVCALNSFGKDSAVLVHVLNQLKDDLGFELKCLNIQYSRHIFKDKKEVEGIVKFWENEGVAIETIKIPEDVTDVNVLDHNETHCSKCKKVRRKFIEQGINKYLTRYDKIKIATGHNFWDITGYSFIIAAQTKFFSYKPKNDAYIPEVLGRFLPATDFGRIRLIRPLLPLSDIQILNYLSEPELDIQRLTTTCKFRTERPKRIIARFLEFLDGEGTLDVSYDSCMEYMQRKEIFKHYAPKIKSIPWSVFTV